MPATRRAQATRTSICHPLFNSVVSIRQPPQSGSLTSRLPLLPRSRRTTGPRGCSWTNHFGLRFLHRGTRVCLLPNQPGEWLACSRPETRGVLSKGFFSCVSPVAGGSTTGTSTTSIILDVPSCEMLGRRGEVLSPTRREGSRDRSASYGTVLLPRYSRHVPYYYIHY